MKKSKTARKSTRGTNIAADQSDSTPTTSTPHAKTVKKAETAKDKMKETQATKKSTRSSTSSAAVTDVTLSPSCSKTITNLDKIKGLQHQRTSTPIGVSATRKRKRNSAGEENKTEKKLRQNLSDSFSKNSSDLFDTDLSVIDSSPVKKTKKSKSKIIASSGLNSPKTRQKSGVKSASLVQDAETSIENISCSAIMDSQFLSGIETSVSQTQNNSTYTLNSISVSLNTYNSSVAESSGIRNLRSSRSQSKVSKENVDSVPIKTENSPPLQHSQGYQQQSVASSLLEHTLQNPIKEDLSPPPQVESGIQLRTRSITTHLNNHTENSSGGILPDLTPVKLEQGTESENTSLGISPLTRFTKTQEAMKAVLADSIALRSKSTDMGTSSAVPANSIESDKSITRSVSKTSKNVSQAKTSSAVSIARSATSNQIAVPTLVQPTSGTLTDQTATSFSTIALSNQTAEFTTLQKMRSSSLDPVLVFIPNSPTRDSLLNQTSVPAHTPLSTGALPNKFVLIPVSQILSAPSNQTVVYSSVSQTRGAPPYQTATSSSAQSVRNVPLNQITTSASFVPTMRIENNQHTTLSLTTYPQAIGINSTQISAPLQSKSILSTHTTQARGAAMPIVQSSLRSPEITSNYSSATVLKTFTNPVSDSTNLESFPPNHILVPVEKVLVPSNPCLSLNQPAVVPSVLISMLNSKPANESIPSSPLSQNTTICSPSKRVVIENKTSVDNVPNISECEHKETKATMPIQDNHSRLKRGNKSSDSLMSNKGLTPTNLTEFRKSVDEIHETSSVTISSTSTSYIKSKTRSLVCEAGKDTLISSPLSKNHQKHGIDPLIDNNKKNTGQTQSFKSASSGNNPRNVPLKFILDKDKNRNEIKRRINDIVHALDVPSEDEEPLSINSAPMNLYHCAGNSATCPKSSVYSHQNSSYTQMANQESEHQHRIVPEDPTISAANSAVTIEGPSNLEDSANDPNKLFLKQNQLPVYDSEATDSDIELGCPATLKLPQKKLKVLYPRRRVEQAVKGLTVAADCVKSMSETGKINKTASKQSEESQNNSTSSSKSISNSVLPESIETATNMLENITGNIKESSSSNFKPTKQNDVTKQHTTTTTLQNQERFKKVRPHMSPKQGEIRLDSNKSTLEHPYGALEVIVYDSSSPSRNETTILSNEGSAIKESRRAQTTASCTMIDKSNTKDQSNFDKSNISEFNDTLNVTSISTGNVLQSLAEDYLTENPFNLDKSNISKIDDNSNGTSISIVEAPQSLGDLGDVTLIEKQSTEEPADGNGDPHLSDNSVLDNTADKNTNNFTNIIKKSSCLENSSTNKEVNSNLMDLCSMTVPVTNKQISTSETEPLLGERGMDYQSSKKNDSAEINKGSLTIEINSKSKEITKKSRSTAKSIDDPTISRKTLLKKLFGTSARTRITKPNIKTRHERIDSAAVNLKKKKRWILNTEFESLYRKVKLKNAENINTNVAFITNLISKTNELVVNTMSYDDSGEKIQNNTTSTTSSSQVSPVIVEDGSSVLRKSPEQEKRTSLQTHPTSNVKQDTGGMKPKTKTLLKTILVEKSEVKNSNTISTPRIVDMISQTDHVSTGTELASTSDTVKGLGKEQSITSTAYLDRDSVNISGMNVSVAKEKETSSEESPVATKRILRVRSKTVAPSTIKSSAASSQLRESEKLDALNIHHSPTSTSQSQPTPIMTTSKKQSVSDKNQIDTRANASSLYANSRKGSPVKPHVIADSCLSTKTAGEADSGTTSSQTVKSNDRLETEIPINSSKRLKSVNSDHSDPSPEAKANNIEKSPASSSLTSKPRATQSTTESPRWKLRSADTALTSPTLNKSPLIKKTKKSLVSPSKDVYLVETSSADPTHSLDKSSIVLGEATFDDPSDSESVEPQQNLTKLTIAKSSPPIKSFSKSDISQTESNVTRILQQIQAKNKQMQDSHEPSTSGSTHSNTVETVSEIAINGKNVSVAPQKTKQVPRPLHKTNDENGSLKQAQYSDSIDSLKHSTNTRQKRILKPPLKETQEITDIHKSKQSNTNNSSNQSKSSKEGAKDISVHPDSEHGQSLSERTSQSKSIISSCSKSSENVTVPVVHSFSEVSTKNIHISKITASASASQGPSCSTASTTNITKTTTELTTTPVRNTYPVQTGQSSLNESTPSSSLIASTSQVVVNTPISAHKEQNSLNETHQFLNSSLNTSSLSKSKLKQRTLFDYNIGDRRKSAPPRPLGMGVDRRISRTVIIYDECGDVYSKMSDSGCQTMSDDFYEGRNIRRITKSILVCDSACQTSDLPLSELNISEVHIPDMESNCHNVSTGTSPIKTFHSSPAKSVSLQTSSARTVIPQSSQNIDSDSQTLMSSNSPNHKNIATSAKTDIKLTQASTISCSPNAQDRYTEAIDYVAHNLNVTPFVATKSDLKSPSVVKVAVRDYLSKKFNSLNPASQKLQVPIKRLTYGDIDILSSSRHSPSHITDDSVCLPTSPGHSVDSIAISSIDQTAVINNSPERMSTVQVHPTFNPTPVLPSCTSEDEEPATQRSRRRQKRIIVKWPASTLKNKSPENMRTSEKRLRSPSDIVCPARKRIELGSEADMNQSCNKHLEFDQQDHFDETVNASESQDRSTDAQTTADFDSQATGAFDNQNDDSEDDNHCDGDEEKEVIKELTVKKRGRPAKKRRDRRSKFVAACEEDNEAGDGETEGETKIKTAMPCLNCNKTMSSLADLKFHMMIKHTKLWSRANPEGKADYAALRVILRKLNKLTCQGCGRTFKFIQYYTFHLKWCGREDEQEECELCHRKLKAMWMAQHIREHRTRDLREEMKNQVVTPPPCIIVEPGSKRQAALKARTTLKDLSRDILYPVEDDSEDEYTVVEEEDDSSSEYSSGNEGDLTQSRCEPNSYRRSHGDEPLPTMPDRFNDVLKWHESHSKTDNLYKMFLPLQEDWKTLNKKHCEKYEPSFMKSIQFCISQVKLNIITSSKPTVLNWAQSYVTKDQVTSYCGGSVNAIEWCPHPVLKSANQYAAVACHMTRDQSINLFSQSVGFSLIEIWKFGSLKPLMKMPVPTLCLSLVHDFGCATSLSWCPRGAWQDPQYPVDLNVYCRLGLLAVSSIDGHVRIFSIPHPEEEAEGSEVKTCKLYDPKPCILLTNIQNSDSGGCLTVTWQPTGNCDLVIAGYANGLLRMWNLSSISPLLVSQTEAGTKVIHPIRSFYAHSRQIRSLSWHQTDPDLIASSGDDKKLRIWRLDNLYKEQEEVNVGTPVTCVKWPLLECGVVFGKDSIYLNDRSTTAFHDCGLHPNIVKYSPTNHMGAVVDLEFSDWYNVVISCDTYGTLRGARFRDTQYDDINVHAIAHREFPIYYTDIKRKSKTVDADDSVAINQSEIATDQSKGTAEVSNEQSNQSCTISLESNKHVTTNNQTESADVDHANEKEQTADHVTKIVQSKSHKKGKKSLYDYHNYAETNEKCCLEFSDHCLSNIKAGRKKKFSGRLIDNKKLSCFPIESLSSISLNKNIHGSTWLLSGGEAGFLRLHNLSGIMSDSNKEYIEHLELEKTGDSG